MAWSRIQGHDHLVDGFRQVAQRGRLAHAYLFAGPSGVGKHLFARELAKAILCEGSTSNALEACDRCAACALVDAGTHPDLVTIARPEDSIIVPIESVRDLCAAFSLKPARGHGKIAILDDADDLTDLAANCFLKTLEEPPPRSVLILIGSSVERQLPTILSRCHAVRFAPLPENVMATILRLHEITDPATIKRLTHAAGGSPGQALALADPDLWNCRAKLLAGLTRERIDVRSVAAAFIECAEKVGKDAPAQRQRAALILRLLIEAFCDAQALALGALTETTAGEDLPLLRALIKRASLEKISALVERCMEAEQHLDRYVQVSLVLDALVDALCQLLEAPALAAR